MLEWSRFIEITRKQMFFFCKQRNHWCWTNFLLSEANWPSDCNPSHLQALRGNILTHHYCSMCMSMSQQPEKYSAICFTLWKIVSQRLRLASHVHVKQTRGALLWMSVLSSCTDARTAWRCCLHAARAAAFSVTHRSGRATFACSSSKTRPSTKRWRSARRWWKCEWGGDHEGGGWGSVCLCHTMPPPSS